MRAGIVNKRNAQQSPCRRAALLLIMSGTLAGCMMGPDYHSPQPPKMHSLTDSPQRNKTVGTRGVGSVGAAQHFVEGQDIPAKWWALYHSKELNELIVKGLAHSPNLVAAKATLVQAQEALNAQYGATLLPSVTLPLSGQRQKFSAASLGAPNQTNYFSLYNASVNVSYTVDLFGAARRGVEALQAQVDYQKYQLEAAYITLTANIVTTAVAAASFQAQIQATRELLAAEDGQLRILRRQVRLGGASGANVALQETQVAQLRATLPPLEQSFVQSRHALAVLIGELPSESQLPMITLSQLRLPRTLPLRLPSSLAEQRPDIQAADALLHAASAQVGVAIANLYPQLTLSGSYGWTDTTLSQLFTSKNNIWNYGGSLLAPIYAGGSLMAKKRGAIAGFEIAAAQYRQTVLQAFQNISDTLQALQHDAKLLQAQQAAVAAAKKSLTITRQQYRLGGANFLALLTAQGQYQQVRLGLIQAEAARYNDTAALFQAMGGGWWNRKAPLSAALSEEPLQHG